MIGKGNGPGPGPHYFQDVISEAAVFLRDVDGLGDGFAPSLYCHERDWLHAGKQRVTGEEIAGVQIAARWRTGDAVFRDHFECFVAPPLDEWFGFDALPPADDPAWERRAVAEASRPSTARRDASPPRAPTASSASSSTCASAT
ncbi:hypothetical protein SO694_00028040 [Aureococcus anophagefferens]|uniref:Uncharacterized protein n=1 Tax=Aureococcus anophagefferens TaxID=44056 RepID=A0ABR1FVC2_AURAN